VESHCLVEEWERPAYRRRKKGKGGINIAIGFFHHWGEGGRQLQTTPGRGLEGKKERPKTGVPLKRTPIIIKIEKGR